MTKSRFGLVFLMLILSYVVKSQNCDAYLPLVKGKTFEIQNFNVKDKLQSTAIHSINNVVKEGGASLATIQTLVKDNSGKEIAKMEYSLKCTGSSMLLDMKSFISPEMLKGWQNMEMKVEGGDLELPLEMKVGSTLKDGRMKIDVLTNGVPLTSMEAEYTNRKLEKTESITVPAGTFNCTKLTYDIKTTTKLGFSFSVESKSVEYYSPGKGIVRAEFYDKKGKLTGYNVLSKID